jgi:hypothetical protein
MLAKIRSMFGLASDFVEKELILTVHAHIREKQKLEVFFFIPFVLASFIGEKGNVDTHKKCPDWRRKHWIGVDPGNKPKVGHKSTASGPVTLNKVFKRFFIKPDAHRVVLLPVSVTLRDTHSCHMCIYAFVMGSTGGMSLYVFESDRSNVQEGTSYRNLVIFYI